MCTPEEAWKEGNNEMAQAEDYQVLDNISQDVVSDCIIEEVPGRKSHANDATDEEIVIADSELSRKINDEDVQAQCYQCSVCTNSYFNTSKSYLPHIPHEFCLTFRNLNKYSKNFK